jgi:cation diffusion facilitator CzcD-associated flavoprotein CzcO
MYEFCIIGAGVTGLSLLLLLQEASVDLSKVAIIDPHFDGGDLARLWTNVLSNTPWSKTTDTLREACPSLCSSAEAAALFARFPPSSSTSLAELASFLCKISATALRSCSRFQYKATQAIFKDNKWHISLQGAGVKTLQAKRLILTVGATPRSMHLPLSTIPLDIALDPNRLKRYVTPGQRVLLFGTMHSGTLIIRNLVKECQAKVTAFYKGAAAFTWDRDGAYDGLKGEAAEIADAIQRGEYSSGAESAHPSLQIFEVGETAELIQASLTADWVVYAMGFEARHISLKVDEAQISSTAYDGDTGALSEAPMAWGFGTAYPNRAPDRIHWDVSIAAFLKHMKAQLPALLR